MAVDRVEKRLLKVTAALDAAGIKYAVIGGNAVAAWVARVDPSAVRNTVDVDILVNRSDADRVSMIMSELGFARHDLRRMLLFTDPQEPSKRSGVHLVWADELVRPSYECPAPSVKEAVRDPQGFAILDLPALVRMKLTSFRLIDQVHIQDLHRMNLLTPEALAGLPAELARRCRQAIDAMADDV